MSASVPNDAGHSPAAAAGEIRGSFLCIGHSGGGLTVAALTDFTEEPDNPIFNHCNLLKTHKYLYNTYHSQSMKPAFTFALHIYRANTTNCNMPFYGPHIPGTPG